MDKALSLALYKIHRTMKESVMSSLTFEVRHFVDQLLAHRCIQDDQYVDRDEGNHCPQRSNGRMHIAASLLKHRIRLADSTFIMTESLIHRSFHDTRGL